jgi:hypothetical protein
LARTGRDRRGHHVGRQARIEEEKIGHVLAASIYVLLLFDPSVDSFIGVPFVILRTASRSISGTFLSHAASTKPLCHITVCILFLTCLYRLQYSCSGCGCG